MGLLVVLLLAKLVLEVLQLELHEAGGQAGELGQEGGRGVEVV